MIVFACLAFASLSSVARATTIGWDANPLGEHDSPTVKYAYWDTFTQTQVNPPSGTTYTFNGVADGASTLTGLSLSQNTPHILGGQGSGLLNGGDVYYSSTFAQNWTLGATSSIEADTISFQIKTSNVNVSVINQLFAPTLVGFGPASYYSGLIQSEMIGGFTAYVIEYRWAGLDIPAGTPLAIQFSMAGGSSGLFTRKPVDFVSLDVSSVPVPEPSSVVLLGLGAVVALFGVRRRVA
jgi:hypothetical protein